MRGHVRRRGSTWTYVIDLAPDPATGRRRQRSKGGFPTKRAAEEAMRAAIARGTGGTGAGVRLGDYLDEWLEAATPRLRETTAGGYARAVEDIKEGLGAVRLRDLTPLMIERFYAELSRTGGRQGTGPSSMTSCSYTNLDNLDSFEAGSYCLVLDRMAVSTEKSYWVTQLIGSSQLPGLWAQIAGSTEYYNASQ